MLDWSLYPNFTPAEMACRHTGEEGVKAQLMFTLQFLRDELEFPLMISSGYRSRNHPAERDKDEPGEHSYGLAADVCIAGDKALKLVDCALEFGVTRIGVKQHGPYHERFIHLGLGDVYMQGKFRSAIWSYP